MKREILRALRLSFIVLIVTIILSSSMEMPSAALTIGVADVSSSDTGSVTGRVTTPANVGVGGAYVAIVSIYDPDVEFYNTTSDAYGYYQFTGVNNTLTADGRLDYAYMIHASHAYYGEGYMGSFGVSPNNVTNVDVVLYTEPQNVSVTASRDWVTANGTDYTIVTAYVTDANGNPVCDGLPVGFELLNQSGDQAQLGNASTGVPAGTNLTVGHTVNGYASVAFGWTMNPFTNYTITAFYHDNRSMSGSTVVYSIFPKDDPGMVSGRVTTATGNAIGNAYVAIVSAYNTSIVLYDTTSGTDGYYQFASVNNTLCTDGSLDGAAYKIYVRSPYGEGYSSAFGVKPVRETVVDVPISAIPQTITVTALKHEIAANGTDYTIVTANVTDAFGYPVADGYRICFSINNRSGDTVQLGNTDTGLPMGTNSTSVMTEIGYASVLFGWAITPDVSYTVTAAWADNGSVIGSTSIYSAVQHGYGAITGRVTTSTGNGVRGDNVTIVSAYNKSLELYSTTSDVNGYYNFTGIRDTLNTNGTLSSAYVIRAYNSTYGEGYSTAFGVRPGCTAVTSVCVSKPVNIVVTAEKSKILANGADHTTISAYVTDAFSKPIPDGTPVRFHMGTNTSVAGKFAGADNSVPESSSDRIVPTANGYAKIEFGWMTKNKVSNTIYAYWANSSAVSGTITISSTNR